MAIYLHKSKQEATVDLQCVLRGSGKEIHLLGDLAL